MKIIVVGGTGHIGAAVVRLLADEGHEVIAVGGASTAITVDIASEASIRHMYEQIGQFDALVAATGSVKFARLAAMSNEDYLFGLRHKLMGQVNLVREGLEYIRPNGSFTLTSGILNVEPIPGATSAAMANGGLEAFVTSACDELPKGVRLNLVSPTVVREALHRYGPFFKGYEPVSARQVAMAYYKSISSQHNGRIYKVGF